MHGDGQAVRVDRASAAAAQRLSLGTIVQKPARRKLSTAMFVRAYLSLFLARPGAEQSKAASLARFGHYEVRLIEFTVKSSGEAALLWVELFAHDTATSLDSFECDDLDDAVGRADEFVGRAQLLHERSQWRRVPRGQPHSSGSEG